MVQETQLNGYLLLATVVFLFIVAQQKSEIGKWTLDTNQTFPYEPPHTRIKWEVLSTRVEVRPDRTRKVYFEARPLLPVNCQNYHIRWSNMARPANLWHKRNGVIAGHYVSRLASNQGILHCAHIKCDLRTWKKAGITATTPSVMAGFLCEGLLVKPEETK